ncbi:MAG: DUF459 domain-containing protein [Nannocystaceae bacterium]
MTTDARLFGRRALLRGALAGATLGALGARPSLARAAAPRVLILGDSMIAGGLGLFLENGLRKEHGYEVRRFGKSSTGLSRPDFFDWMKEGKRQIDAFPEVDAVVVMFGGNDVQGLFMGKSKAKGTEWIIWPDAEWPVEYARRVTAFADLVAPAGRDLFWIGMPVMRPEKFHERVQRVNTIYRAEMAIRPGGHFVDIWRLLADGAGRYTDRLTVEEGGKSSKIRVRAGDGIHLSVAGAHHVEAHVRARIVARLGAPGGEVGAPEVASAAGEGLEAPTDEAAQGGA